MDNKQPIECIRKFKLRQQYPSMITKPKNLGKQVVINAPLQSLVPVTTKLISKNKVPVTNGSQKFRLKLPSGKDLGECNVKILPNYNDNNILKNKAQMTIDQNVCKTTNKIVILPKALPKNKMKKLIIIKPLRPMDKTVQKKVFVLPKSVHINKTSCYIINNIDNAKSQSKIISAKNIVTNDQGHERKKNMEVENMHIDTITNNGYNENEGSKPDTVKKKLTENKNNLSSKTNILSDTNIIEKNKPSVNICTSLELPKYVSLPKPVKPGNVNNSDIGNSRSQNNNVFNMEEQLYLLSKKNRSTNLPLEQGSNVIESKSINHNLAQQIVNTVGNEKSIPKHKEIIGENVTMVLHGNGTSLSGSEVRTDHKISEIPVNNKIHNVPVVTATSNCINFKSDNVNTFQSTGMQFDMEQSINDSLQENHSYEDVSLQKMSSSYNIFKKAVSTIKNKEHQEKLLKALADCGIMIEQQIPLDLPTNTRTVHDRHVQTDLRFDLNVTDNIKSIEKLLPDELCFENLTENLNVNSLNYMPFHESSIFSPFNQSHKLNKSLDGFMDNICNIYSVANEVKEVLLQSNPYNKIIAQLRMDFENARKWDENGMLNIHKAVIGNRTHDVQRHLMVFKACNINVDLPTKFGMTSLELAIEYNVSAEIVKLLLETGANPTSSQLVHDSALILACKANSPLLLELIRYVRFAKLLNYMDFTGFAPLHYCAEYGNLEGVNALINKGANVNLQELRSGRTPLFLAIENNHTPVAKKLIKHGAMADISNFAGQTVMSLAHKMDHLSLVTMLCEIDNCENVT